ncbi:MAG: CHAT domain-containing protein [Gemmataceae bacterium]
MTYLLVMCLFAADEPAALARADKALAAGKLRAALDLYRKATEARDRAARRQAYARLLDLTTRLEMPDQTVREGMRFRRELTESEDRPLAASVGVRIGMGLEALGQYRLAEEELTAALPRLGGPEALLLRLLALARLAKVSEAIHPPAVAAKRWRAVEEAVLAPEEDLRRRLEPEQHAEAVWLLCESYFYQGRHKQAVGRLAALLEDGSPQGETLRRMAEHYEASGDLATAAKSLRRALEWLDAQPTRDGLLRAGLHDALGDVLGKARKPAEAEAARQEAGKGYVAVVKGEDEAVSPFARSRAFWKAQRLFQKIHQYQRALTLITDQAGTAADAADPRLRAKQGTLNVLLGSYKEAQGQFAGALKALEAGEPLNLVELPRTLNSLAVVEQATGRLDEAERLGLRCLGLYREHRLPDDETQVEAYNLLGANAALRGQFAQGIDRFRQGVARCVKLGPKADRLHSGLLLNQSLLYKAQGDLVQATDLCKQALAVYERSSEPDGLGVALFQCALASLNAERGQFVEAAALAGPVLEACKRFDIVGGPLVQTAQHCLALGHLARGRWDDAQGLWRGVLASQEKGSQSLLLPRTLNYLALIAELKKQPDAARGYYERADGVQRAQERAVPTTRFVTLWRLATLVGQAGDRERGRELLLEAIEGVEKTRQATYGDSQLRTTFLAQFVPAFEQAVNDSVAAGRTEEAFDLAGRVRSRAFLDQLLMAGADPRATLAGPEGEVLKRREADLAGKVTAARASLALLTSDTPDGKRSKGLADALDRAQLEYAAVWREILNLSPAYRGLADEEMVRRPLAALRKKVMRPGVAVLSYHLQRGRGYAMLVADATSPPEVFPLRVPAELIADLRRPVPSAAAGVTLARRGLAVERQKAVEPLTRPVPPGSKEVDLDQGLAWGLVEHYRCLLERPDFGTVRGLRVVTERSADGEKAVRGLPGYAEVVVPAALRKRLRELAPETLLVVPDGVLHKLPLESLMVSAEPDPAFLLDELPPTVYAPSVSSLAFLADRKPVPAAEPSLLTVNDPAYAGRAALKGDGVPHLLAGGMPRLPESAEEGRRVSRLFGPGRVTALTGREATEGRVTAAAADRSMIHVAAHGYADVSYGNLFGALALVPAAKPSPGDDGFLTLVEVYRLDLSRCELAVLSACETNVGPQQPLEAGVTLASAFLAAGARRVVATHWSVADRSASELVGTFFERVLAKDRKVSYARALQEARKKVRRQEGTSSPFHWAPFVLLGGGEG